MTETLHSLMARTATGYAGVIDGVLDIRTVTDTRKGAAISSLLALGFMPVPICPDPDCDCLDRNLHKITDRVTLVPVSVQLT